MELTIAIVSYNARDELENCLRSILENTVTIVVIIFSILTSIMIIVSTYSY